MSKIISKYFIASIVFVCVIVLGAANIQSAPKSPAKEVKQTVNGKSITIKYGSPSVRGREIWGKLVPYSEVWRTGANEATTFEVSADVVIEGQNLPKGIYSFFTIPTPTEWTLIFNSGEKMWGTGGYSEKKDVLRVKVTPSKASQFTEAFTINVDANGNTSLVWENLSVPFSIK